MASLGRPRALRGWIFWALLALLLLAPGTVLAASPTPNAPTPLPKTSPHASAVPSPSVRAVVTPPAGSQPAPEGSSAAIRSGASASPASPAGSASPASPSTTPSGQPGASAVSPSASSRATPQATVGTATAASGSAGGQQVAPPPFCPQVSLTPLAGCQALPAPVQSIGLASSGTPVAVALIGLLLIAAGWLLYRRSRKPAPAGEDVSPASPADAR
ncbi:MAG: hypothetical protein M3075_13960 [Candidatus Dormibacteraeota bacterium]|nr:hypothetical protein [Candidatus Dormibacteraeota bacterium]